MGNLKAKNYIPGSISFGDITAGQFRGDKKYLMEADWDKAKTTIENLISEGRNIENVVMGLDGDWCYNSMVIWENGKFEEYNCHGASGWAEPIMIVNYKDAPSETYSVWKKLKL